MAKPESPRCARPDCKLQALAGSRFCADHQPRPRTLHEKIAGGVCFVPRLATADRCSACGDPGGLVDATTGLCRACWRIWRWSPVQEHE